MKRITLLIAFITFHFFSYSQANSAGIFDGIYVKENSPQKKEQPKITCTFKEFSSKDAYEKSKKQIQEYQLYKNAPFAQERTIFVNPALYFKEIDTLLKAKRQLQSLMFYINTNTIRKEANKVQCTTTLPYETIYQPFYIFNAEVTNWEYRAFIDYVRDSIARTLIAKSLLPIAKDFGEFNENDQLIELKWDKKINYENEEIAQILYPLYLQSHERFYSRKEIDSRKLNYEYHYYTINKSVYNDTIRIGNVINIVPDTLMWTEFKNDLFELYSNMYAWHPLYSNHPVVNISYKQAKAFMIWRTEQLQKYLNSKKTAYEVEYDFPSEVELEIMELITSIKKENSGKKSMFRYRYPSELVPPSLSLVYNQTTKTFNYLSNIFDLNEYYFKDLNEVCFRKFNYLDQNAFPAVNTKPTGKLKDVSANIYSCLTTSDFLPFLNGNVSEWMKETFSRCDSSYNIDPVTNKKRIWDHGSPTSKLFPHKGNFENYYSLMKGTNSENIFSGIDSLKSTLFESEIGSNRTYQLVRGANWYDPGDCYSGSEKRNFVSQDSAHATIGFRCVLRFKKKEK